MRTIWRQTFILGVAFGIASCGGSADSPSSSIGGSTGVNPTGGSGQVQNGGSGGSTFAAGGNSAHPAGGKVAAGNGGVSSAGNLATSLGGTKAAGGSSSDSAGNSAVGGAATGGKSAAGVAAAGGAATGGKSATGGAAMGGGATGGKSATGGAAMGGTATGGKSGSGITATGGVTSGGAATTGGAASGGTGTTTSDPCSASGPLIGGTSHCNENNSGNYGNYVWQLWSNSTTGCLTTYSNGAFGASWNGSADFLALVGLKFDDTKTLEELGTFSANFAETSTGTAGAFSYIGVYGWLVEPNTEFYIIEDSFNSLPFNPGSIALGTLSADGGVYDIYKITMTGTKTIYQAFSIRRTSRRCGHVSISEHFSRWASLGIQLGKVDEVAVFVESGQGTGSIEFTTVSVVMN